MRVNFRQGIVRYQTDINGNATFLQRSAQSGAYIDLIVSPDPTIINFAHKGANYLYEEARTVTQAWGPFPVSSGTRYLYWDLSILNATISRGFTTLPPVFSAVSPTSPAPDQHWFDTSNTCMKVWDGTRWVEKIRVFAASYVNGAIIRPYQLGSQAGNNTPCDAGNIVLDIHAKPLRMSDGTFATSASQLSVVGLATKTIKVEAAILQLLATEQIPTYHLVRVLPGRRASLARHTDIMSRVAGLAVEDIYMNEVGTVVREGLVRSPSFNWPASSIGRPLFCGANGELTTVPNTIGVIQQVGQVWDTDAVMMDVQSPVLLDDPFGSTPTPPPASGSPEANFATNPFLQPLPISSGTAPLTVQFQDTSTNSPTLLEWDFTNDGTVDSNASAPTYTFAVPGTYSVRLRAQNGVGASEKIVSFKLDSAASTAQTNLEITLATAAAQVVRNTLFTVNVLTRNEGLATATNVARQIVIPDVGTHEVTVANLPAGATTYRSGAKLIVDLPAITSLSSGGSVNTVFSVRATPIANQTMVINASVSSPETDPQPGDNTTSLSVLIRP